MIAFLTSRFGLLLIAAIAAVGLLIHTDRSADRRGYERRVAEENAAILKRASDATRADADHNRCAANPDCLRQQDGWRRD